MSDTELKCPKCGAPLTLNYVEQPGCFHIYIPKVSERPADVLSYCSAEFPGEPLKENPRRRRNT